MPHQDTPSPEVGPPAINIISSEPSPPLSTPSPTPPSRRRLSSDAAVDEESISSNSNPLDNTPRKRRGSHPHVHIRDDSHGDIPSGSRAGTPKGHRKRASFALTVDDDEGGRTAVHDDGEKGSLVKRKDKGKGSKSAGGGDGDGEAQEKSAMEKARILLELRVKKVMGHKWFNWVLPKITWGKMKPVVRTALASWLGLLMILILPVERSLGNGAFFLLIVGFMVPPSDPLIQSLEKYLNLFFFAGLAWAWTTLAVFIAHKTRVPTDPAKIAAAEARWSYLQYTDPERYQLRLIFEGTYIQAKPAIVCCIFLAAGTGALLWWKLRTQPSPATFPLVLSCILVDVSLTTASFYPKPLYTSGLLFFLPMAVQAGYGILCSFIIFPESVGHSFQSKFPGILTPLSTAMKAIDELYSEAEQDSEQAEDTGDFLTAGTSQADDKFFADRLDDWADRSKDIRLELLKSLAGIPPLRAQQRYLSVDFSYSRLSGEDLRNLFDKLALVQARSGGMAFFFDVIVTNAKHSHLDSSAWSVHHVHQSRPGSRAASIRNEIMDDRSHRGSVDDGVGGDGTVTPPAGPDTPEEHPEGSHHHGNYFGSRRFNLSGILKRSGSPHGLAGSHKGSHMSLLDQLRKTQQPVGVYESTRYMDIERNFAVDTEHVLEQLGILARGSVPVIRACEAALSEANEWILNVNHDRRLLSVPVQKFMFGKSGDASVGEKGQQQKNGVECSRLSEVTGNLQSALDDFQVTRLEIVRPYRHLFDPNHPSEEGRRHGKIHFRGLFQNFVAQYHLMEFSQSLLKLLRLMEELDKTRQKRRFWYPHVSSMIEHFHASHKKKHLTDGDDGHDNDAAFDQDDEEDVLGEVKKRNPEYKPFDSPFLNLLSKATKWTDIFSSRSLMYAIKAAVLGALTTLPNFISSSAAFYYYNRGVWCTIMAQLTLAVYSGDTAAAWLGRVVASFWGCLFGMVVWYIGSGSGQGNAYGLGAACAVAFLIAAFFRVHFPGPVLTAVMTPVTFALVIGYSYFNGTIGPLTYAQWGWDVAWRRFVCVLIGITAAWMFSYIPPVFSAKLAIRQSYAQTISAAGTIFCDVLSHANDHHYTLKEDDDIRQKLISWRSKLNKLGARHSNAALEYSLRGQWPEERYKALLDTLQDLFSLLSQLNHVLTQLDRPWRKALLDRTRLSDPMFLGDVLVVLSMCSTALRAGTSLPQITPSPLVARFRMGKTKGLDLPHDPTDSSGELPSLVTVDVLESDNYMRYALGITTTFSLISRIDRIVVICKTLLGENFHISGLQLDQSMRA
ncbi:hypothetical protein IAT38_005664 [Cryptococcus sp. DSM 104549]